MPSYPTEMPVSSGWQPKVLVSSMARHMSRLPLTPYASGSTSTSPTVVVPGGKLTRYQVVPLSVDQ